MHTRSSPFPSWLPNLFLNSSVRVRLMSLLGTISLLTFLFCASSVIYFVSRSESASWLGRQGEAARSAARAVTDIIQHAENTLVYLAQLHPEGVEADSAVIQNTIGPHAELLEVIRLDSDGTVIAGASRDRLVLANLFTIRLSEWFKRAQAGEYYYSGAQLSSDVEPYIIVAFPTVEGGVIAARLRMEVLWTAVADIRFGTTGRAYVINQNEQVIAHSDPAIVIAGTNLANQPELNDLVKAVGHEWSGEHVNFEGNAVVVVSVPIGTTGWILITELSQAEAYATTRTAVIVLGSSILLFMMLIVFLARIFLHQTILNPMERLRLGAERIGRGDLDHRIDLHQRDEIGLVAMAFDEMVSNLRDRERELTAQATSLATEVIEHTRAEAELRESETRYRAIVEDQTELICRFHADGALTFVNDAYCRYFGRQRDELVGHTFVPLIPVEDHPLVEAQLGSLSPENPMTTYEHRVLLSNDEVRWMQWTDRLISDTNGTLVEFQAVGRDVTERRQAEEEIKHLNADLEQRVMERTEQLASANAELQNEITERKRVEIILNESRERLQQALSAARAGAWEWNMTTNRAIWSEENYRVMGLDPNTDESHFDNWLRCVHPEDRQMASAWVTQTVEARTDLNIEFRVIWPDSSVHWINDIGRMKFDTVGQPIGMYGIQMDITERKLASAKISASLHEKEILLKEIHHRVKNNLQIISSLLNLQSNAIDDPLTLAQFQDSQNRVRSMALIHERLYRSEDLARIDFGTYLRELARSLVQSYRRQAQSVSLKVEIDTVMLDIDTAIPCGLIVNELVSNALKHGFPNGREGQIGVEIHQAREDGQYRLVVWDDGVGIPADVDYWHTPSLGLQLVNSLSGQLGGDVELCRENGTRFDIRFSGLGTKK